MEAPEKIYVQLPSRKWIGRTWNETPIKEGDTRNWKNATNIEYTRTDAIVERACELLVNCIEDFMLRRMEIWDEECKKQTLENIRKKLEE